MTTIRCGQFQVDLIRVSDLFSPHAPKTRDNAEYCQLPDNTGLDLWGPSSAISILALNKLRLRLSGASILELGAGVGACSLFAAKCGAQVLATDYHPASLQILEENRKLNLLSAEQFTVKQLDWNAMADNPQWETIFGKIQAFDFIVASDVIFASRLLQPIVQAICFSLGQQTEAKSCVCLLGHEVRLSIRWDKQKGCIVTDKEDEVLKAFKVEVEKRGLAMQLLAEDKSIGISTIVSGSFSSSSEATVCDATNKTCADGSQLTNADVDPKDGVFYYTGHACLFGISLQKNTAVLKDLAHELNSNLVL